MLGDVTLPGYYKSSTIDYGFTCIYSDYCTKTESDALFANSDLGNINTRDEVYNNTEVDDTDNELSTLILNTYTKTEIDTVIQTNYYDVEYLNSQFGSIYIKTEVYDF